MNVAVSLTSMSSGSISIDFAIIGASQMQSSAISYLVAQEESRSISENVTWGQRKRFADGKISFAYSHFLGYDKGADGNLVVNPEEAKVIVEIFQLFLQ